ncbi:MAG TPA: AmmeMemoRadiSam system protein A [Steroidobacteraceae bacterium]|nr:AmmeMemoRadiSam system protein A [Steroidobacteraceae bacterium]
MAIELAEHALLPPLARRSIVEGHGRAGPVPVPRFDTLPAQLLEPGASFVTLKRSGELRGCRGLLEPIRPLAHDVWHNAWASAYDDPRFPPVGADELSDLDIEVSLLSALERVLAETQERLLDSLEPGRHGVVLALGPRRATFLPQVWKSLPEPSRFLAELKSKAGIPQDYWSPDVEAWRYTTRSLGEPAPGTDSGD